MLQTLITGTVGPVPIYQNSPVPVQSAVDQMWFRISSSILSLGKISSYVCAESRYLIFSARCNIYISHLCYDVRVCLSVTEVHWRFIANLGFKFRSKFTTHCGRSQQCARCGCIVVAVHGGIRGGVISRYASHC